MDLRAEHLSFSYFEDAGKVFEDFSASFSPDHITLLTGRSGSGKSTLLYLLAGLYPSNGGFLTGGRAVLTEGTEEVVPSECNPPERARYISMMFQNPDLQFCMDTVRNELIFTLENIQTPPEQFEAELERALTFCGISHLKDRTLHSLSGGEKQKVTLACQVLLRPRWLLLDEPFANVDNASAKDIAEKLKLLHETEGTGLLVVEHRLENWLGVADVVRILEKKTLLPEEYSLDAIDPDFLEEHGIIVPGRPYPVPEALKPSAEPKEPSQEAPVLSLRNLSVSFGDHTVLKDVTADFLPGTVYALVGESGSGKSTLFHALSGVAKYKGDAVFLGTNLKKRRKAEGTIGFVTQSPQDQFVADTVLEEILTSFRDLPKEEALATAEHILRDIRLWRYRELSPYLLSQGQQRRLGVAALMAYHCKLLVCDEPTYAQDRANTLSIMESLCTLAREQGTTLIFSCHDLQLARDFADVIFRLEQGALIPERGQTL